MEKEIFCKACNGKIIQNVDTNELTCQICGFVNGISYDEGPESQAYDESTQNRCNCSTNIFTPQSSQGTILKGKITGRLKRKQIWDSSVYKEKNFTKNLNKIQELCNKNIPPYIFNTIKILYKKLTECKHTYGKNKDKYIIIRGKNKKGIIAACVARACEINKYPISTRELAKIFKIKEQKITIGKRKYRRIIENQPDSIIYNNNSIDHITRYAKALDMSEEYIKMGLRMVENCLKLRILSDHNIQSLSAGIINLISMRNNLEIKKRRISEIFSISETTINKITNELLDYEPALIDKELMKHLIKKFDIKNIYK